ncbi:hypothetical protein HPB50_021021 [Hyalomma asiaticum]|uniref:Uncharacterized protein n=1 Tax=Hyalomma asiaticum TaxID=266040 RepID=A0ACB7SS16_HYAAI|nr:hypothetical protein HPB50_021021 [Hyalomma asiaticum]
MSLIVGAGYLVSDGQLVQVFPAGPQVTNGHLPVFCDPLSLNEALVRESVHTMASGLMGARRVLAGPCLIHSHEGERCQS